MVAFKVVCFAETYLNLIDFHVGVKVDPLHFVLFRIYWSSRLRIECGSFEAGSSILEVWRNGNFTD